MLSRAVVQCLKWVLSLYLPSIYNVKFVLINLQRIKFKIPFFLTLLFFQLLASLSPDSNISKTIFSHELSKVLIPYVGLTSSTAFSSKKIRFQRGFVTYEEADSTSFLSLKPDADISLIHSYVRTFHYIAHLYVYIEIGALFIL